jgi:hypothetical protein
VSGRCSEVHPGTNNRKEFARRLHSEVLRLKNSRRSHLRS